MEDGLPHGARSSGDGGLDTQAARLGRLIAGCSACALHKTRLQTVFGEGSLAANLVLIGEAPGAVEDREGLPFWGPSGRLLRKMLVDVGFERGSIFITNSVRCRPPKNRNPSVTELNQCSAHLEKTIELIQPQALLAVGAIAARALSGETMSMQQFRLQSGSLLFENVEGLVLPIYFTYHPAYILRNPHAGPLMKRDLSKVWRFISVGKKQTPKTAL